MKLLVKDRNFYKDFFRLTLAVAFQNVVMYSVNLADNIMLGSYSADALAGSALAGQLQFILQMTVTGLGEGALVLSSRYWGEKDIPAVKRMAAVGLACASAVTLIMWALVFLFPGSILGLLTNDPGTIAEGVKYIKIVCFSYPFYMLTSMLIITLRSVETVKIGVIINLSTLFVKIFLNYFFIFGNMGFPELGSRGAALSTVAVRILESAIVLAYCLWFDKKIRIRLRDFFSFDMPLFRLYAKIGLPVFFSSFLWGIAQTIQTGVLGHMGKEAIIAASISGTVFSVVSVAVYGSSSATGVIIGRMIGAGEQDKVRSYSKTLQFMYLIIGLLSGLCLFVVKDIVVGFYDISGSELALTISFMTILSITLAGTAYQVPCLGGIVRSGGDTKFVLYNDLIWMWLIVLPLSSLAAFVFDLSPVIVFFILKCDQLTKCAVAFIKVNCGKIIKTFES